MQSSRGARLEPRGIPGGATCLTFTFYTSVHHTEVHQDIQQALSLIVCGKHSIIWDICLYVNGCQKESKNNLPRGDNKVYLILSYFTGHSVRTELPKPQRRLNSPEQSHNVQVFYTTPDRGEQKTLDYKDHVS